MSSKIVFLTLVAIVAARLWYVENFAVAMPFWDQWDAEGDFLLRPWMQGTLKLSDLWQTHNEHRIFPTRILSLVIFIITGAWNNLVEARFNVLLATVYPVMLTAFLVRQRALCGLRWLLPIVIVAQFALPFSYENFLVGFQSQFYFLLIFTLSAVLLAVCYPDKYWAYGLIAVICALSVLTMASGLFTALAVAVVFVSQMILKKDFSHGQLVMVLSLLAIAIAGYLMIPHIAANQGYRAKGLGEFLTAMGVILSWPVTDHAWVALLLWLPGLAGSIRLLTTRRMGAVDLVMVGCFAWSLMQAVAIAYGRGHWLTEVSSRYTDLFGPGLIANAWFAVRLTELMDRFQIVRWVPLSFFIALAIGFTIRQESDMKIMHGNYANSLAQAQNVVMYMRTGDPAALRKPMYQIPYPHQDRLQHLLEDPTLRRIIPASSHVNPSDKVLTGSKAR